MFILAQSCGAAVQSEQAVAAAGPHHFPLIAHRPIAAGLEDQQKHTRLHCVYSDTYTGLHSYDSI